MLRPRQPACNNQIHPHIKLHGPDHLVNEQVRDRATLYITQLQEADGQPVPPPAPWNISSRSLEAALQAYLADGGQSAPFDLVCPCGVGLGCVSAQSMMFARI